VRALASGTAAAEEAIRAGRFDDAVEALAAAAGRAWRPSSSLAARRDPSQDLLYAPSWRRPSERRSDLRALRLARRASARNLGSSPLRVLCGLLRFYTGDLTGAMRELDAAVRTDPDGAWAYAWRYAVKALLCRRDRDASARVLAAADLDQALRLEPSNPLALALRAEYLHDRERYAEALSDLDALRRARPDDEWALVETGEILSELGRLDEARLLFDRLLRAHRGEAWAWALRGRGPALAARPAEGLRDLDRAVALAPRWGALRAWRGEARRRAGDARGALLDFDAAVRLGSSYTPALAWRGRLHLLEGRLKPALRDLDRALRGEKGQALFLAWRGEARFRLGRWEAAAADFDGCFPFHPRLSWSGPREGREARFEGELGDAAARHPGSAWAQALHGRFLMDSARRGAGLEVLARLTERRPRFAWALAWLGEGLRRDGRLEEARRALDAAAHAGARCFFARAWSSRLAFDESHFVRALAHAQAALRLRPRSALAIGLRGRALLALGRARDARGDLELASALEPKDDETRRLRDESIRLCGA